MEAIALVYAVCAALSYAQFIDLAAILLALWTAGPIIGFGIVSVSAKRASEDFNVPFITIPVCLCLSISYIVVWSLLAFGYHDAQGPIAVLLFPILGYVAIFVVVLIELYIRGTLKIGI